MKIFGKFSYYDLARGAVGSYEYIAAFPEAEV